MMSVEQILANSNFWRHRWHGPVGEHGRVELMKLCVHGWIEASGARVGFGHGDLLCNATNRIICVASFGKASGSWSEDTLSRPGCKIVNAVLLSAQVAARSGKLTKIWMEVMALSG